MLDDTQSEDGPALPQLSLPEEGTVLEGRYVVERMLGSGGMGAVFAGKHLVVKRPCAIKFLRMELAGRSRSRSRFEREAEVLGGLVHDNLTSVLDFGFYGDNSPYLVMEYIEGQTLRRLLQKDGRVEPERALRLLKDACAGLAFAHENGVIHRDLKPDNLMVTRRSNGDECVKILDFGIARAVQSPEQASLTPTGADLGTPHYMSREQARGEKQIDARADVYAIGVILYEMLTGQKPHPGDTYNQVIFHLLTESPVPVKKLLPECPSALQQLIERCISNNPERRYANGAELLKELNGVLGRVALEADGVPPVLDSKEAFWKGAAAGAGVVLALGVLPLLLFSGGENSPSEPLEIAAETQVPPSVQADSEQNATPESGGPASIEPAAAVATAGEDRDTAMAEESPESPAAEQPDPAASASPESEESGSRRPRVAVRRKAKSNGAAPDAVTQPTERSSKGAMPDPGAGAASGSQQDGFKFLTDNPYE